MVSKNLKIQNEFLANMSHELRTPLNSIIGFSELIYNGQVGAVSPVQKEYLRDILASSYHLLKLIDNMLDLSKAQTGTLELCPIEVNLTKLVHEVYDEVRSLLITKRIGCEIHIDSHLNVAIIDPSKFKQILYNYLSNAIKFSPVNGKITIAIEPFKDKKFKLSVKDEGLGIKKNDFKKLFIEFKQLDSSTSKIYQGTGIGLALTKKIVALHGGEVGVDSSPGKGSTFYAILPLTPFKTPNKKGDSNVK